MSRQKNEFGGVQKGPEGSEGIQRGPEGSEEFRWVLRGYNNSMYV